MPAGRGAITPQLSLSYSSRAGNGLLGVGWSLGGMSTIAWCARTIAQDGYTDAGHFDGTGALCLNGSRLVPISPAYSPVREYRTEQESFTRIIAYETQDNVPNFFRIFTKDGKILTFGGSAEARVQPFLLVGSPLPDPSLVRMPGAPRATTAWLLDRIEDRNGNAATVQDTRTEGTRRADGGRSFDRHRSTTPRTDRCGSSTSTGRTRSMASRGGTHTRTDKRMKRIEMWGGPQDGTAERLRQCRLRYSVDGFTGRSLLRLVTECDGADREPDSESSVTRRCKLAVPFEYSLGSYRFEEIDVDASR